MESVTDSAEIGYAAGLFDGEGCLSTSPYARPSGLRHHCDIFLGMQNRAALERFQRVVGVGTITRRHDLWMYWVSGAKSGHVVRMLLPYLTAKREAAALYVEFAATFSLKNKKPLPEDIAATRADLSTRIRQLMRIDARQFRPESVAALTED